MPETIVVLVHLHPHERDYWLRFAKTLAIPTRIQFLREQISPVAPGCGSEEVAILPMTTTNNAPDGCKSNLRRTLVDGLDCHVSVKCCWP